MANFVLPIDKPQGAPGGPTSALVFIDNGDGTFTMTVNPAEASTYPSNPAAIVGASGIKVAASASAGAGGANTQVQFNSLGALAGITGATSDGTKITIAPGDLLVTNISDAAAVVLIFQDNTNHNWGYGQGALAGITTGIENTAFGGLALNALTTGNDNATLGFGAGFKLTTATQNTFIGTFAGINITTGGDNTAVGFQCMQGAAAAGATQNIAVGSGAGNALSSGQNNVLVGWHAGIAITTGSDNTCVGQQAGLHITTGGSNVLIGELAGATSLTTGSGNVFIGKAAGQNESGSNKLYIANSNTATPLIGGDFSAGSLTFTTPGGTAHILLDAGTNTIVNVASITHNSSGTPVATFGAAYRIGLQDSTTADQDAGRVTASWTTATHATRSSQVTIQAVDQATSLADVAQFSFQHNAGSPVAQIIAVGTAAQANIPQFTAAGDVTTGFRFSTGNIFGVLSGADHFQIVPGGAIADAFKLDFVNADVGIARVSAGVLRVSNGSTGMGTSLRKQLVSIKTANYPIVVNDSGTVFSNAGAGGEVDFTLPTAAAGLTYTFIVEAAQTLKVIAGAATTIRLAGSVSAAAGNITNATIGGTVRLTATSATTWVAEYFQGTWTVT